MESTSGRGVGEAIKALREELGVTQKEFARVLGVTVETVNRWENGRFKPSKLAHNAVLAFAAQRGLERLMNA